MSAVIDLHVPDLEARILPGLEAVEDRLHQAVSHSRDLVTELTSHLAQAGGKRMRPLLTLVAAQFGDPERALSNEVLTAATGIELTHLASLYHDDVMDSAPTRRGVPSAQHLWGNNRAILAGDILFARASAMIATLGDETVRYHAITFERLCMGQLNETFGPQDGDDPLKFYIQVLADKTGSLVASAAAFGAMHAGADQATIDALTQFGERLGVAFQIADDVIDLGPEAGASGKTRELIFAKAWILFRCFFFAAHSQMAIWTPRDRRIYDAREGIFPPIRLWLRWLNACVSMMLFRSTGSLLVSGAIALLNALPTFQMGKPSKL